MFAARLVNLAPSSGWLPSNAIGYAKFRSRFALDKKQGNAVLSGSISWVRPIPPHTAGSRLGPSPSPVRIVAFNKSPGSLIANPVGQPDVHEVLAVHGGSQPALFLPCLIPHGIPGRIIITAAVILGDLAHSATCHKSGDDTCANQREQWPCFTLFAFAFCYCFHETVLHGVTSFVNR
jgi:hypothetical protein